jgi:2-methylcitrate dehydratase PrpD
MITQRLAEFVIDTRTADVPGDVLDASRDALIDTIGVALVGSLDEVGEITLRYVSDLGARREAAVWGSLLATTTAEAAFANGVCGHALDFDDVHASVHGHPSTTLVPAIIAAGEAAGASGRDVLAAYAVGLEVGGKLGAAFGNGHYQRGWHSTATTGVFATAAAAARLLGLSVAQLRHALGLAASQASGLLRNFGTMTKPFHAGHAARCGVQSALLARAGFTADISIFDGDTGFLRTYGEADAQPLEPLVGRLGKPWEAVSPGISYKRWPCCYCNHRSIGVLLEMLKKHDIKAADVQAIEIGFPPGTDTPLIHMNPQTGLEAKFSIEYSAAATILDGKVGIDTYTDVMVNRPEARAMLKKVRRYRIDDGKMYSGAVGFNDVLVRTGRGEFKARESRAPGSPDWPMSAAERNDKFLDCAGRVLGSAGAKRVLDLLVATASLPGIAELTRAMVPPQDAPRPGRKEPAGAMAK